MGVGCWVWGAGCGVLGVGVGCGVLGVGCWRRPLARASVQVEVTRGGGFSSPRRVNDEPFVQQ